MQINPVRLNLTEKYLFLSFGFGMLFGMIYALQFEWEEPASAIILVGLSMGFNAVAYAACAYCFMYGAGFILNEIFICYKVYCENRARMVDEVMLTEREYERA